MGHFARIAAFILAGFISLAGLPALAQSGQTLDNNSLQSMLGGMGYSPKALTKGYLIAISQDSWTFNMQLVLSDDQSKLGMNANLGVVEDLNAVSASQWLNLMAANEDVDPSTFYLDKDQKKLYLHRVLDNHGITAAFLRDQIEKFTGNIKDTADLWDFTK